MHEPPVPPDEPQRLEALRALGLLDTPAEERFERITRMAQRLFDVPIALVSLVDRDRQWFKSRQGLDASETPRGVSFCAHAILHDDVMVVPDARTDERFRDNPLVEGDPGIRFYAGYPLHTAAGRRVGTLCVLDRVPRDFGVAERELLRDLGRMVEAELGARLGTGTRGPASAVLPWHERAARTLSVRAVAGAVAVAAALVVLGAGALLERRQAAVELAERRSETRDQVTGLRGSLETELNARLHLVHGLIGFLDAQGEVDPAAFERFARRLRGELEEVRSLQLAPGGIVTHVYPLAGNEAAIGHDLLGDPRRRADAERAIRERRFMIAGPVELVQGGTAVIGRRPIFVQDRSGSEPVERFWGFATILLDFQPLLAKTGIAAQTGLELAMRRRAPGGGAGKVFYGDASVFERDPIVVEVTLPNGAWEMAAVPAAGWSVASALDWRYLAVPAIYALIVGGLVYFFLRLPSQMQIAIARATRALERSEARFRDAIEALPDGFVVYDADDRLAACNENYRRLYERSRPVIEQGRTFEEIIRYGYENEQYAIAESEKDLGVDALVARRLARHRNPSPDPVEQLLADGRWVRIVERRMRDGGMVGFRVDITELKEKEAELRVAKDRAEEANRTKSAFLATVSHEVRTPLNGVLGLIGLLREDTSLDGRQRRFVDAAYLSARHLLDLLNEILDVSKMEAGKLTLETAAFGLRTLVDTVSDLVRPACADKGLALQVQVDKDVPDRLEGDSGRLRQVLLNLTSNAVKFTDGGEVRLLVSLVAAGGTAARLRFAVEDTGIGISPEEQTQIFERFTQADGSMARRQGGVGLGLAISRAIVELMGSEIALESASGAGARFSFDLELPLADESQFAERADVPASVPVPADVPGRTKRVLLAEDSPTNQLVIRAMLENTGYRLEVVGNGKEAVESVEAFPFDLVLMDVSMPEVDGMEATRRIRALPERGDVPIVALTANAMKEDEARVRGAGMNDYLSKPIDKRLLLQAMAFWSGIAPGSHKRWPTGDA